jgi:hypothetical protein
MNNIKLFLLAGCLTNQLLSNTNKIITSQNLNQLKTEINSLTTNDLVIFDVGNVIIRRTDNFFNKGKMNPALKKEIFSEYNKFLSKQGIKKELSHNEMINLWSSIKNSAATQLFAPQTIEIIKNIQKKNIKCIAHTKMDVGTGTLKEKLENYRIKILLDLNINFENSFKEKRIELVDNTNKNSKPIYKNGVLFADKSSKGESLKLFLKKVNFKPKKIVMIDDQKRYLESVLKTSEDLNINFIGIHYIAIKDFIQKEDKKLNKFQLKHYFEKGKWLKDEKTKFIMEK